MHRYYLRSSYTKQSHHHHHHHHYHYYYYYYCYNILYFVRDKIWASYVFTIRPVFLLLFSYSACSWKCINWSLVKRSRFLL